MSAIDDLRAGSAASLRAQAAARWRTLTANERLGITLALLLVGAVLVWGVTVQPALRVLVDAPQRMEQLDAQWQHMQRLAAEAAELRAVTPVSASQVSQVLEAATDRLGGRARISVQGDRATLTITAGITGEALRGWLAEARSGARARPMEMRLARGAEGYTGTLVVTVGGRS